MKDLIEKSYNKIKHITPSFMLYSRKYFSVEKTLLSKSQERIDLARDEQLRRLLLTATRNTEFYGSLNIPEKIIANEPPLDILGEFPYIEKDMIMDEPSKFINKKSPLTLSKYATSGGSTGRGIGIWRSKESIDIERLFFNIRWGRFGYSEAKSKTLRIGANARRKINEPPTKESGSRLLLSPYHINPENIKTIILDLERSNLDFIHSYPSCIIALTQLLQENCPAPPFQPKALLLASEPITLPQLKFLHSYWGCPISVNYGLSERTNIGFYQYTPGDPEIIYKLEPLYSVNENHKETEEIVGTALWNETMPLIRYRTKDYGKIENDTIKRLQGREQDFLIDRFNNKLPGTSVVIDETTWDQVRQYQVLQKTPGKVELIITPRHSSISEEFKNYVLSQQKDRWGDFFDISLTVCKSIPLTPSGKSKLINVQINKNE